MRGGWTIDCEVAAGGGAHSVVLRVSLQREFAHQLGPAVRIVGVIRTFGEILREIELLFRVRLQKIWVDAARRSEPHFSYFGFERFGKAQTVQKKVRRRAGLVEIHVPAPAVVRGEMENSVNALHRGARHTWFPQISLQKINFARAEMLANVFLMSAAQVVDDANFFRAPCQKLIGKRRTDE